MKSSKNEIPRIASFLEYSLKGGCRFFRAQKSDFSELNQKCSRPSRSSLTSKVFDDVAGPSANLRLTMNKRLFAFSRSPKLGMLLEMTLSDLIYRRCHVFLFALRIMHRVAADPAELTELAHRLEVGTKGITRLMVYRYALGSVLAPKWPRLGRLIKGRAATAQV